MVRKFEIKPIKINDKNVCYNFFVDGIGLDKILGVDRLSDMRFSNFDFDVFEVEKTKFPQYNRLEIIKRAIDIYTGIEKPFNQFGTDRVVLYRCHCGCDYCGILSFKIVFDDEHVYWRDIQFESDNGNETCEDISPINELQFEKVEYMNQFSAFLYNIAGSI